MNLIRNRVSAFIGRTTFTPADCGITFTGSNWSLDNAIIKLVNQEDDARYKPQTFEIVPELPYKRPNRMGLLTFIKGVLP